MPSPQDVLDTLNNIIQLVRGQKDRLEQEERRDLNEARLQQAHYHTTKSKLEIDELEPDTRKLQKELEDLKANHALEMMILKAKLEKEKKEAIALVQAEFCVMLGQKDSEVAQLEMETKRMEKELHCLQIENAIYDTETRLMKERIDQIEKDQAQLTKLRSRAVTTEKAQLKVLSRIANLDSSRQRNETDVEIFLRLYRSFFEKSKTQKVCKEEQDLMAKWIDVLATQPALCHTLVAEMQKIHVAA